MNEAPVLRRIEPEPNRRRRIPPLRGGVYILPNLFTTAGLFAGFYSITCTMGGRFKTAALMIVLAQVCDFLDGRVARWTRSASSFGVEYDSLADLISFGVAPGILVYQWALQTNWGRWGWLAATLYVTCGALRLARFNVQIASVEKRHFVGLPIPAAALVIASTVLLHYHLGGQGSPSKHITMLLVIFALAALMVSEIRYFSFKEMQLHRRHPFWVLILVIVLMALIIAEKEWMIFLGITAYALSGPSLLVSRLLARRRRRGGHSDEPSVRGA